MPQEYDRGRTRIKGTDPRVRAVTDKIGRGTRPNQFAGYGDEELRRVLADAERAPIEGGRGMPGRIKRELAGRDRMTADMAAEAAGRRPSDADINDDFARRLMGAQEPDYVQNPPARDDAAYRRAMANRPTPSDGSTRRYVHETDIGNVESIRREGIRPGNRFGHDAVWANEGTAAGRTVPKGRALIEFEADPARIKLRGTTPGSKAAGFQGGPIEPSAITGGYGPSGRIFDAGSRALGIGGLINMLSSFVGGPYIQTPSDWVLNDVIAQNYNGGIMDPYRDYEGPRDPQTGAILA